MLSDAASAGTACYTAQLARRQFSDVLPQKLLRTSAFTTLLAPFTLLW